MLSHVSRITFYGLLFTLIEQFRSQLQAFSFGDNDLLGGHQDESRTITKIYHRLYRLLQEL